MSVRLIKISKDLNVGINSLVEFLHKKGFDIDANPNTKIDSASEQYKLLINEFGSEDDVRNLKNNVPDSADFEKKKNAEPEVAKVSDIDTVKDIRSDILDEFKPHIQVVDKIDLDSLNKKKNSKSAGATNAEASPKKKKSVDSFHSETDKQKMEQSVVTTELKLDANVSPEQTQDVLPDEPAILPIENINLEKEEVAISAAPVEIFTEIVSEKLNTEIEPVPEIEKATENIAVDVLDSVIAEVKQKEEVSLHEEKPHLPDDVFRLNNPVIKPNIVIKGSIDLSAINVTTRPAKKTKEERKKERLSKELAEAQKHKSTSTKVLKKESDNEPKKTLIRPEDITDENKKKKRNRIKKGKVDIEKGVTTFPQAGQSNTTAKNNYPKSLSRKPLVKQAVNDDDVQKQIKETLARLTGKGGKNKGAKYRREKREAVSQRQQEEFELQEQASKILKITEFVTANDLANMMNVPVVNVISTCMSIGMMVSINQRLDAETINIVAEEFGFKTEYVSAEVVEAITEEEDNEEDLQTRPPIVTVMGHVDHGKTSLLDNIRKTTVIAGEAGGITQHIGAYNVLLKSGRRITFLDTPGHEAFTAMRARGAKITDIAIIIVAADDDVMPQTIEAINHASAAGVPIVFAINKIDKPGANPEKIKESLAAMNYLVESWGGKYQSQDISAKQGIGVDELLEKVLLEADLLDLKANPDKRAIGSVVESSLDKGRGYLSTVLIQNGTLKKGDIVLAGTYYGRIKAMFNERNQQTEIAQPSSPALILGLNGAPQAGDTFHVLSSEQEAREIAAKREQLQREQGLRTQKILTLDDIGRRIAIGNFQQLNVIVKGDVDGSVEALSDSLIRLSTEEIQVNVIHKAVGQISESDITLSAASDAIIIGFQVRPSQSARKAAEKDGVEIRLYSIIYDAIEDVKSAMEGMLSPEIKEEITAYVDVREVFKITKVGTVAGCVVKEGKIKRANKIRLIRDGIVIYSGDLGSLKRFKDDVKEVTSGYECGLNIQNYNDIKVGDTIESFEEIEIKKTL